MTPLSILVLGFLLGMRHATDSDHVVAVTTIVSQQRNIWSAAVTGMFWGIGHTATLLLVGGAIIVFGLIIPDRLAMSLEFGVAVMLIVLGVSNLRRNKQRLHAAAGHSHRSNVRPLIIGGVHGLAGSAAVALLVLPVIRNPYWATTYLLIFGVGTIAGMMLITALIATPITYSAKRFEPLHRHLGAAAGMLSLGFGIFLAHQIGGELMR